MISRWSCKRKQSCKSSETRNEEWNASGGDERNARERKWGEWNIRYIYL